jgi:transcriptional regulator with XRE-family HTH domain
VSTKSAFGEFVRRSRLEKQAVDPAFSVRQVARRVGIEPSYLSKIERGQEAPPGEGTVRRIAEELGQDVDEVLALAGKVPADLVAIIHERPAAVAELLRSVRRVSAKRVGEISKQIREGKW